MALEDAAGRLPGHSWGWRLIHSSSFRLMLIYAVFFSLSVVALFIVLGISADGFMTRQIDAGITAEVAEIRADAQGDDPKRMRAVVDSLARTSPSFYYLLQDRGDMCWQET